MKQTSGLLKEKSSARKGGTFRFVGKTKRELLAVRVNCGTYHNHINKNAKKGVGNPFYGHPETQ